MEVLIVDDHPFIHETLRAVVMKAVAGASVHAEVDLASGIGRARSLERLDLVLLDLGLPGYTGIKALCRFRKLFPQIRVAIISATEDRTCIQNALANGAVGYIPKTSAPLVMVAAVRLIAEGGTYVPPEAFEKFPDSRTGARLERGDGTSEEFGLTKRQVDVLQLLIKGLPNRHIAERLDIAEGTVKQHAHAVFNVLGVSSRAEAVIAAARLGIDDN